MTIQITNPGAKLGQAISVHRAIDFLDDVDVSVFEVLDAVKLTDNPHSEKHLQ